MKCQASKCEVASLGLRWISTSELTWLLYKYVASAFVGPLGTIYEEKGISSRFRVSISLRYDLNCRKRRKNPFLPYVSN